MNRQKIRALIGSGSFQNIALAEQLLIGAARELGEYWFHVLWWEAKKARLELANHLNMLARSKNYGSHAIDAMKYFFNGVKQNQNEQ